MTQQISVSDSSSVISTKYYGENPPQVGETYKSKEGVIYKKANKKKIDGLAKPFRKIHHLGRYTNDT